MSASADRSAGAGASRSTGGAGAGTSGSAGGAHSERGPLLTTALLAAAVFLFLLFYAANEPQRLKKLAEEDDVARRERLALLIPQGDLNFMAHCSECHGFDGEGTLEGPALRSKIFLDAASDEMLTEVIVNGRAGTEMKPFAKEKGGPLGEVDIEALVALLRSWQGDAPAGDLDPRKPKH